MSVKVLIYPGHLEERVKGKVKAKASGLTKSLGEETKRLPLENLVQMLLL